MRTKNILSLGIFIFSFLLLSSCDDWFDERIYGNGNIETIEREISSFDEVVSLGDFDVYISIADSTSLIIEAEDNLLPFIHTYVSGQKFYVKEKDGYNLSNIDPMKIFITTPELEGISLLGSGLIQCDSLSSIYLNAELLGSGDIEINELYARDFDAEIAGSGDIIVLEGEGTNTEFVITGSGNIRCINYIHDDSESTIVGSGNIYVYATDALKATISGSGYIYYRGDPVIDEHITGTGDVRRY